MAGEIRERYLAAKRALFDKVYASLNEKQRESVYTVNGPLLVLAGAGSGKTTVLVKRIAFLIRYGNAYYSTYVPYGVDERRVREIEDALALPASEIEEGILPEFISDPCPPWRVLAITFTNKAANEIKNRLTQALGGEDGEGVREIWAGTFHSICMRILRTHGERLGYGSNLTIYDTDDSKKCYGAVMKELNIDEKTLPIKSVMNTVSRAKDRLQTPEMFARDCSANDFRMKQIARIYAAYQKRLETSNAMDFDDIIMKTVFLLRDHEDVRTQYQNRFRYVSVDEFQDTNEAQMELTKLLSGGFKNLMVVGDDDQSIYRFRGATIENILSFDRSFENAKVIKLEQNYRSTQTVLDAANAIIRNNNGRRGKTLWTARTGGDKIRVKEAEDQNGEARYIAETISRMVAKEGKQFRDFAVLYRTNAQSNTIERTLARSGMPYRMLGGLRFSDRKEIRDLVAYLQLINNHADRERMLRIINEPRRKIGPKTLEAVAALAEENGKTMFEIMENANAYIALGRTAPTLMEFAALINGLSERANEVSLEQLVKEVLDRSGYRKMIEEAGQAEADRLDNLDEFISNVIEYQSSAEDPTLTGFLEETALVADVDRYDDSADAIVLMTIHSSKGLEFPIVFLPGMEDGIFPGMQTITGSPDEMEEERRLAYVAVTRAKDALFILHAKNRLLYGRTTANPISRFVSEIPDELIERVEPPMQARGGYDVGRYGGAPVSGGRTAMGASSYGARKPVQPDRPRDSMTVAQPLFKRRAEAGGTTFSAGDRVSHALFGVGEILSVRPMGTDTLYEIAFEKVGTKKMMATYAKLKKQD
ncbi:MAG: UvrD-helicase domain-containing protein [Clostridia bacterium]|nr:UvrD-helicase domain-containing protein [Clostridia bacterium]